MNLNIYTKAGDNRNIGNQRQEFPNIAMRERFIMGFKSLLFDLCEDRGINAAELNDNLKEIVITGVFGNKYNDQSFINKISCHINPKKAGLIV